MKLGHKKKWGHKYENDIGENLDEINENLDGTFNMDKLLSHMNETHTMKVGHMHEIHNNMDENEELVSYLFYRVFFNVILVMLPIFIHR